MQLFQWLLQRLSTELIFLFNTPSENNVHFTRCVRYNPPWVNISFDLFAQGFVQLKLVNESNENKLLPSNYWKYNQLVTFTSVIKKFKYKFNIRIVD